MERSRVQIKQSTTPIPSFPWGKTFWSSQLFRIHDPLQYGPVILRSMVLGPAASASPDTLLEVQILRFHPRSPKSETLGVEPSKLYFHKPFSIHTSLRTNAPAPTSVSAFSSVFNTNSALARLVSLLKI